MKQNISIPYNHETLGPLTIEVIAQSSNNSQTKIKQDFVNANINKPTTEFLFSLYQEYMSDETLIDIIGEFLECNTKLSNQQIVDSINEKYTQKQQSTNKKSTSDKFVNGNGINVYIKSTSDPNSPLFTANFTTKSIGQTLTAYLDSNFTREDVRRQGLHTLGMNVAKKYFASNGFSTISLEAQDLDGNDFDLAKMYQKDGLTQIEGTNMFVMSLDMEDHIM